MERFGSSTPSGPSIFRQAVVHCHATCRSWHDQSGAAGDRFADPPNGAPCSDAVHFPAKATPAQPFAVTNRFRACLAAFLSLLLLGMQSEGLRHSLAHEAAAAMAPTEQSLQLPDDAPCVECQLIAGSNDVVGGWISIHPSASVVPLRIVSLPQSALPSPPSFYQGRAPPDFV